MSNRINAATRWNNYDAQTVTKEAGNVDHMASAKENLGAAWNNLKDGFDPNNRVNELWSTSGGGTAAGEGIMLGIKLLATPWAVAAEVAEAVSAPFTATKNVVDAGVHAVAAGVEKITN